MLYSTGASYNTKMSHPDLAIQRRLAGSGSGLAGIKGLSFSYRLNTWGAKQGPPMMAANDFPKALIPSPKPVIPSGVGSAFTWMENLIGVEPASDILQDAVDSLNASASTMNGQLTTVQNLISQAQAYDASSDQSVLGKAQACEAEGAGLVSNYQTIVNAITTLQNQITPEQGDPNLTKDTAQGFKTSAATIASQVSAFQAGVAQLQKDVSDLKGTAQSGPGVTGFIENLVSSSTSKLTWIVGGGLMIYLLAPSFIPRLAHGVSKARKG